MKSATDLSAVTRDLVVREWMRGVLGNPTVFSKGGLSAPLPENFIEEHNAIVSAYRQIVRENEVHSAHIVACLAERDAARRERDTAQRELAEARKALRGLLNLTGGCFLCKRGWQSGEAEVHEPGCPATPDAQETQTDATS